MAAEFGKLAELQTSEYFNTKFSSIRQSEPPSGSNPSLGVGFLNVLGIADVGCEDEQLAEAGRTEQVGTITDEILFGLELRGVTVGTHRLGDSFGAVGVAAAHLA